VVVSLLLIACGRPAPSGDVSYVLEPQSQPLLSKIFERMKPTLRYTDVAIEGDGVEAHLCRGDADDAPCFRLRLEHPSADCEATRWGSFCARFLDGPAPPEVSAVIADALRASADAAVWTKLVHPAPVPPPPVPRPALPPGALETSLALTLLPLGTGLFLGKALRRLLSQRRKGALFAIAAVVVPALSALLVDARIQLIGAWDALYVGVAAGAGLLLALHRAVADAKNLALLLGSCIVGVFALEVASRLILPPPPAFPSAEAPTLFLSELLRFKPGRTFSTTQAGLAVCDALYGDDRPTAQDPGTAFPATWNPRSDAREHILHLGDSMVFGSGHARFTDRLNELEPLVEHVNAAIAGTGPDVYLALLRRFLAQHRFTAVVMHLTPNDYGDVDQRQYSCSGWLPLLMYGPSGTRLRFPTPRSPQDESRLAWLMQNSPPPYILRAAVGFSSSAAHLSAALVHTGRRLGYMYGDEDDRVREAHLAAILRDARDELQARHIPFVVDILRDRGAVEAGTPTQDGWDDKLEQIAKDVGIVTMDTWEPLVAAARRGENVYMSKQDPHFNYAGHVLIAAWLHEELRAALAQAANGTHADPRS
jgi:hypothetical protein